MGFYIPKANIKRLHEYKYSSTDKSLTSKYILNPFWSKLVLIFPLSVAPNMITLLGLLCVFIDFGLVFYLNPELTCSPIKETGWTGGWTKWIGLGEVSKLRQHTTPCGPQWMYFLFSVGLFAYQSLDAIDGKQARRTGTSGPLGELFDHGCDAMNVALSVTLAASAMNIGLGWWTVTSLILTAGNFYLTTWEEFHTGTLYLSEFSGPVEGILMVVVLHAITGFVGPTFWDNGVLATAGLDGLLTKYGIKGYDIPINIAFMLFSALGLVFNIIGAFGNVYKSFPPAQRTLSHLLAKPLARLTPFVIHTASTVAWLAASEPLILRRVQLTPFMLFWGISFAHSVGLVIVAHLSKQPFPAAEKHLMVIWTALCAADAVSEKFYSVSLVHGLGEDAVRGLVGLSLLVSIVVYGHFVYDVVGDICEEYDINCLTIKHKEDIPANKEKAAKEKAAKKKDASPAKSLPAAPPAVPKTAAKLQNPPALDVDTDDSAADTPAKSRGLKKRLGLKKKK